MNWECLDPRLYGLIWKTNDINWIFLHCQKLKLRIDRISKSFSWMFWAILMKEWFGWIIF